MDHLLKHKTLFVYRPFYSIIIIEFMNPLPNCFVIYVGFFSYFLHCVPVTTAKYLILSCTLFLDLYPNENTICFSISGMSLMGSISYHLVIV